MTWDSQTDIILEMKSIESFKVECSNPKPVNFDAPRVVASTTSGIEAPEIGRTFLRGEGGLYLSEGLHVTLGTDVTVSGDERLDLIEGRDDSAHDVRFWNITLSGSGGSQKIVMADKHFGNDERPDAEREVAASALVETSCGVGTFDTLMMINDDKGVRLFSTFDPSVKSLDNLDVFGGAPSSLARFSGALGIASVTLAKLHSAGITHGDAALKNLATSVISGHNYPFVIDLEDAKFADSKRDKNRLVELIGSDINRLANDLLRRGWLRFGSGDQLAHFNDLFLSQYLSHITQSNICPKPALTDSMKNSIRENVSGVSELVLA